MKKSAEADFYLNVPQSGTYRIEDISCETYRAEGISRAAGTKKRCSECRTNNFPRAKNPRPLAEGVGEGSQHLHEGFRAQAKPKIASSKEKFFSCEPRAAASPSKLLC
jgi:hypothetical protein